MHALTKDIYVYNNEKLNERDYFLKELLEKRIAIDEVLKEYLIKVITQVAYFDKQYIRENILVGKNEMSNLSNLDVFELVEYLRSILLENDANEVLSSIIFYVMGLIEGLQSFSPDWRLTKEEDAIENPVLVIRGNKLYSLETHADTDMFQIFSLVYSFLQNKMEQKNLEKCGDLNDVQKLSLKDGSLR